MAYDESNEGATRTVIENSHVESSKSNGVVERAVQSARRMIRTIESAIEEKRGVKNNLTHAIWPWIAERARFFANEVRSRS